MKYFKDKNDQVYAYESNGSQDDFMLPDLIKITEKEAKLLANPPLSHDKLVELAEAERVQRRAMADLAMAPLIDATELDDATNDEIIKLQEWKKYRVALNRIDTSTAPDIEWPITP